MNMDQISLVIILLSALAIPLIMARFQLTLLPTAVVEIIVGVVLGPSLFNLIHTNATLSMLKDVGVIVLLFLSGLEIDFSLFSRKRNDLTPLEQKQSLNAPKYSAVALAFISYGSIVIMSAIIAVLLNATGMFTDIWLAMILFMTISLGIVIAALKEINARFEDMHRNYYTYEWTWAYNKIQEFYGFDTETITAADVIRIVEVWKESVIGLDRMVYDDARKEFSLSSMTGFGADGTQDERKLDFEQVRGDFESNPFVTAVLKHIDEKTALGNELINRIGKLA